MKKFFEEYGYLALAAIVVVLLISMASPVGNLIKASTAELVTTYGDSTNNFVNSFEVTNLNGPTVNLISFTVGYSNSLYQAEEGMTWNEWVKSEYNTTTGSDRYVVDGTCIRKQSHVNNSNVFAGIGDPDELGAFVFPTATIIKDHWYGYYSY